jgi:hypothetical protein
MEIEFDKKNMEIQFDKEENMEVEVDQEENMEV